MNKILKYSLVASSLFSPFASAIGVDQMIKFADGKDAKLIVSNDDGYRQFINILIADGVIKDGELAYVDYTRENIQDWTLEARPSRFILDNKNSKQFKVTYANYGKNIDYDEVYKVSIIPSPYLTEEQKDKNTMQIAVGFAPIVIFPAVETQKPEYESTLTSDQFLFNNTGKTYVTVNINSCPSDTKAKDMVECAKTFYALSGRKMKIDLTDGMKKSKDMRVEVTTHNVDHKENYTIKRNQTIKSK